jgi:sucrose phosphorylase
MPFSKPAREQLLSYLKQLYAADADECLTQITARTERRRTLPAGRKADLWDERDVVLITYGDQVHAPGSAPLQALRTFLNSTWLNDAISTVHLLPFFPYSSDDGFSVIDFREVDANLGTWEDVDALGRDFGLMFDLVLNHCSSQSRWFQSYLQQEPHYSGYFIEADSLQDLSAVTRPRSLPLLTPFDTASGPRNVWTTFSGDQIDLNFANPQVLLEMLDVLLFYVEQGARIIRLDAIAYLWKRIGTSCIHLAETHAVVKLLRLVLDELAPGTIVLTETNVPHEQNVSYFGDNDEAHMVYQFSLAPLLLDAFLTADAGPLNRWLFSLEPACRGTTFFNFTASHDGVGVRPLEGLVPRERLERLVESVRHRGGRVSAKQNADGSQSPYELNISYFSALGDSTEPADADASLSSELHVRRFLSAQSIMLALRGIPGIYFHSLVGTPNNTAGVRETGRARTINRRKFQASELRAILERADSPESRVFDGYRRLVTTRIRQPAFHPDAEQTPVDIDGGKVIAFLRSSIDGEQRILVLANVAPEPVTIDLSRFAEVKFAQNLLDDKPIDGSNFELEPYASAWLSNVIAS